MKICFIPIDNRPVCYSLAKDIVSIDESIEILMPPREILGGLIKNANLDKTIGASQKQVDAIMHIKNTVGLSYLSDDLKELAEIRLENPYISLRELGDMLSNPISRSGVNHRLKRICEIANGIE